jgi:DNA-binding SARP family transcriptional activator
MDDWSEQKSVPFFRVWLCGTFRAERRVGDRYEVIQTTEWGGSTHPRQLLKALLCCPGRQGRREALIELLWPEMDFEQAVRNFNTATTKLRAVLRPARDQESLLVTEDDASVYRLADQQLLWVDADAGVALLKEAEQIGRTQPEALPLLEEAAAYFNRGTLLEGEEGLWVAGRRATLERTRYRCRLWLSEAYERQGQPGQAETVLSFLLEEDPLDEDILCRLMELLHEQGMTSQALHLYTCACETFTKEGIDLTENTRNLATRLSLRQKKSQGTTSLPLRISEENNDDSSPSQSPLHGIIEYMQGLAEAPRILKLACSEKDSMDTKRRELLHLLSTAGMALALSFPGLDWERIEQTIVRPSYLDAAGLQHLEVINRSLWDMYLTTPTKSSVFEGAFGHFKMLVQLLKDSHPMTSHRRLCLLTSEMGQLVGEIFFDLNDYQAAEACYVVAAHAAKEAQSYDLWACALVRSAFLPIYSGRYEEALVPLQSAFKLAQRGDSMLPTRYWVAAVEAEARSGVFDLVACQQALNQAQDVQQRGETPPPWVRFSPTRLPALRGACYVRLRQPELALPSLQEALSTFVKPDRKRGMVLIDLAATAVQHGEVEQARLYIDEILTILALGSSGFLREGLRTLPQRLEAIAQPTSVKAVKQYLGKQRAL